MKKELQKMFKCIKQKLQQNLVNVVPLLTQKKKTIELIQFFMHRNEVYIGSNFTAVTSEFRTKYTT